MDIKFRVALAQINPTVGALSANGEVILKYIERAKEMKVDLLVFPELAITGYPPEDLLTRSAFIKKSGAALERIAERTRGITTLIGAPYESNGLRNVALIVSDGKVVDAIFKKELPNYGVFDEHRYFVPGDNGPLLQIGEALVGVTICEDIWADNNLIDAQVEHGANLLVNISGSPYRIAAKEERRQVVCDSAKKHDVPFAYCNLVGGQDELVFDGRSFIASADGEIMAEADSFKEDFLVTDVELKKAGAPKERPVIELFSATRDKPAIPKLRSELAHDEDKDIYEALTLGVSDYIGKNGFKAVVIGLSGGIDSALTTAIAVDALGPERVNVVMMPSPYSSEGSVKDSEKMAENLGLNIVTLPIADIMVAYDQTLSGVFKGVEPGVTEENIQARIRGALIMALSNKFGWLALTTGNKSEMAVGYATLYGDMAGGFAVIKDLFKGRVYSLSKWRNQEAGFDLIPNEIIEKEPSAELRPDQKDTDSLPTYEILDPILESYIEKEMGIDEIVDLGYKREIVSQVVRLVDINEYKRRQAPVGVKITIKSFGRDRRHPITCHYIDE